MYMYSVISLHAGFTSNGECNSLRSKGNSNIQSLFFGETNVESSICQDNDRNVESVGQICVLLIEVCCKFHVHVGGKDGIIEAEIVNRPRY